LRTGSGQKSLAPFQYEIALSAFARYPASLKIWLSNDQVKAAPFPFDADRMRASSAEPPAPHAASLSPILPSELLY